MIKTCLTALLVVCFLSSCEGGWNEEFKQQFLQACKEGSNLNGMSADQKNKYCDCTLNATMKHYKTITEVVENKDSTQLSAEVEACRAAALK